MKALSTFWVNVCMWDYDGYDTKWPFWKTEHYFEMNKADATTALNIYKTFAQQAELTIAYLNDARKLENDIQLSIPAIKHVSAVCCIICSKHQP